MIKYGSTSLGAKHLNQDAKAKKDQHLATLKGMICDKCNGITFFNFTSNGKKAVIEPTYCCHDFEEKVREKLLSRLLP